MKPTLATARLLSILAAWATLLFAAPLHGASPGFPFAEDFQSQSFLDSTKTTAQWSPEGVTLGRARGRHGVASTIPDWQVWRRSQRASYIGDVALQDINGDGWLDVITAGADGIVVYSNDPASDAFPRRSVITSTRVEYLTFGDYDNNGFVDIAAGSWRGGINVLLHMNDGRGRFGSGVLNPSLSSLHVNGLATADLNGDGHPDLVLIRPSRNGGFDIYVNDGKGGFEMQGNFPSVGGQADVAVGNLDEDGRPDIVIAKKQGGSVFHRNLVERGVWNFGAAVTFGEVADSIALGDVDNDGHLDIALGAKPGAKRVHLNNGAGSFSTVVQIAGSHLTDSVALGDMDGDGDLDLVEGVVRGPQGFVYTNDGDGNFRRAAVNTSAVHTRNLALGDVDNDGDLDVVIGFQERSLKIKENPGGVVAAPSDSLFDTGRGRVVSDKVNGDAPVPHVVYLTATAAQQRHTDIEYYLSNNGGGHWVRAYPGKSVRFLTMGHDLRWRAEFKSHSPVRTTTLTRVGIESALQVFIGGDVFGNGGAYTATTHTIGAGSNPTTATIRLVSRSDQTLLITGIETVGEAFMLQDGEGKPMPKPFETIEIEKGDEYDNLRLVFDPMQRDIHASTLTISSREGRRALPGISVGLEGRGIGAQIKVDLRPSPIEARVGTSQSRTVRITNRGEEPLTITGTKVTNPLFKRIEPATLPTTLTAGNIKDFEFRFKPEARGDTSTNIIFFSNSVNGAVTRTLTGKGVASEIDIIINGQLMSASGFEYKFGRWPIKATEATSAEVIITNINGDASLRVDSAAIEDEEHFGRIKDDIFPAPPIPAGSSMSNLFRVSFSPKQRGVQRATLTVTSNAINGAQTITLTGQGEGAEIGVEVDGESVASGTTRHLNRIIRVGVATAVEVVLHNRGETPLEIEKLSLSNGANKMDDLGFKGTIPPNSNTRTEINLVLDATGTVVKTLEITSDDPVTPTYRVILTSTGVAPASTGAAPVMVVTIDRERRESGGAPYNFGDVLVGETASRTVVIRNDGDAPLKILSVEAKETGLQLYSVESRPETFGLTVSSGHSTAVIEIGRGSSERWTLHFGPSDTDTAYTGALVVEHDIPSVPQRWSLNLRGRGAKPVLEVVVGDMTFATPTPKIPSRVNRQMDAARLTLNKSISSRGSADTHMEKTRIVRNNPTISTSSYDESAVRNRVMVSAPSNLLNLSSPVNVEFTTNIVVWNRGSVDLVVNPIGLSGSSDSAVGKVGHYRLSGDRTRRIPKNSSHTWVLHFMPPDAVTTYDAAIRIFSNDDKANPFTLNVQGVGTHNPRLVPTTDTVPDRRGCVDGCVYITPTIPPRLFGLGYANGQSRLWLAFGEQVKILSGTGTRLLEDAVTLPDGSTLPGFEVLVNYTRAGAVEDIGVLRARYRSGGVVLDLARRISSSDISVWVRYTPPPDDMSGIYSTGRFADRISSVRLFMLPRNAVFDYDGDGFPDALEARLGGNPLMADDVVGLPEVALSRAGAAGSPVAVAYSGIRADGVAAHLGVVTTGASSLAAYYLSDTFGYSGGYAEDVGRYGCTWRFPSSYALPVSEGGCAVVDFNNIRAGVEHRIGWLVTNNAGYWAVTGYWGSRSRLPEQVILRVPEFNMKRRNVFVANSAAADATAVVGAFHDGPASSQSLTVSLSNVVAADSPSSSEPDGFSVSVAGVTTDTTNYGITGVHTGEDNKLWLAGDPLSSLTPDKYSLGKVTQTGVVRLGDDNLPPLFGRASLYVGSTADANERHAVVVRGTENYIVLLPVVHGSAQTASALEVSPWGGAGGGPVAADDRMIAVNAASPAADGALVRIAFTASNPPATVRNTVSLEVAASSAGADTATTVLTWPVIDSADALASIAGDNDNDGIPDVRDSYPLLNRLPISVAGGVSGYPDRSSAGTDGWHHIRPLLPLHNQHIGSYATRAGLSFHTGFAGDIRILVRLPVATSGQAIATSGRETIAAPEGQTPLAATYQSGVAIQMNYADFAASLSRDEFGAMARQSRQDISVVYNFRLHGVGPSAAQDATLAGGRAGVVIPLPESLHDHANILPLHYINGAWGGFSTDPDTPATAGFAPLQAGACPDDSGLAGSPYRTTSGALNTRKRTGDACMVLYLTDGAAADRDGNINGIVEALIGLAATAPPRESPITIQRR